MLASINNVDEKDFVLNLMEDDVWIGLNDIQEEGTFVWQDGTPVSYNHWMSKEPKVKTRKNCVLWEEEGWKLTQCNKQKKYVCSRHAPVMCATTTTTTTTILTTK